MLEGGAQMRIRFTVIAAGVVAVGLCAVGTTASNATPSLAVTAATVTGDQCGLPVEQRVGAWTCAPDVAASTVQRSTKTRSVTRSQVAGGPSTILPGPDPGGGWCDVTSDATACYTYGSGNTVSTVKGTGVFGYGTKVLGNVTYSVVASLNGHKVTQKGIFTATRGVVEFVWQEQLGVAGSLADGAPFSRIASTLAASSAKATITGGKSYSWSAPSMVDTARYNYSAEMGTSWKVTGYSGFWYMNLRSAIWHCASSTTTCYFSLYAPADNVTAGWNP
jgi:hypothetical protein